MGGGGSLLLELLLASWLWAWHGEPGWKLAKRDLYLGKARWELVGGGIWEGLGSVSVPAWALLPSSQPGPGEPSDYLPNQGSHVPPAAPFGWQDCRVKLLT